LFAYKTVEPFQFKGRPALWLLFERGAASRLGFCVDVETAQMDGTHWKAESFRNHLLAFLCLLCGLRVQTVQNDQSRLITGNPQEVAQARQSLKVKDVRNQREQNQIGEAGRFNRGAI
jgi:hypothetical protein